MKRFLAIFALSAALVAGCGSLPLASTSSVPAPVGTVPVASPTAPAFSSAEAGRAMVAARSGYNTAIAAAIVYGKLPACSATQKAPCHDPALLAQMQKADRTAFDALDAADAILKVPGLGSGAMNTAVAAAQAALAAFTSLTGATK